MSTQNERTLGITSLSNRTLVCLCVHCSKSVLCGTLQRPVLRNDSQSSFGELSVMRPGCQGGRGPDPCCSCEGVL